MSEKEENELFVEHYDMFYGDKKNKRPYTKQKLNEVSRKIIFEVM